MQAIACHLLKYFLPIPLGIHFLAERLSNVRWQERKRAGRGSVQSTHGMPQLCHALHGAPPLLPRQLSAGLDAAPHRGFAMPFGTLHGCCQNQNAPKGSSVVMAQCVLPERELLSGPGKREKWRVVLF